jgi:hypothetical protein
MRLLTVWTAVLALTAIVSVTGCGGVNMKPAAGSGTMNDKMMSDSNMMSNGTMADGNKMGGNMMEGKMAADNKMSGAGK